MSDLFLLLAILIVLIALVSGAISVYCIRRAKQNAERFADLRFQQYVAEKDLELRKRQEEFIRQQSTRSVNAARNTIKGQVAEQLMPLMPDIVARFTPSDMRFLGAPVDYLIFDGMTEERDGDGAEITIILADVKTGNASLSKIQRQIKAAIEAGRVRWETIRL